VPPERGAASDVPGPVSSANDVATLSRRSWTILCLQLLLFTGTFALLWPTTASLIASWEDVDLTTYTHGYMIVAISVWLLWRQRAQLAAIPVRPLLLACLPLAVASFIWLVAVRSGIQSVHQLLLPVMAWLAICSVLGVRIAAASAFAIGFLYAAVPFWDSGNFLLQDATVRATDFVLRAIDVPAYVEGNVVHLISGSFEIEGGCSGLHYFIVAVAIAALFGEIRGDGLVTRVKLIAVAALLAVVTNWLRVCIVIVLGHLTEMQHYLVRVEHYRFGWVLFALMMIAFFLIARRMPWRELEPTHVTSPDAGGAHGRLLTGLVVTFAAMALGPAWNVLAPVTPAPGLSAEAQLPQPSGDWAGPAVTADSWQPRFIGADHEQRARYIKGDARIELFVATYGLQEQGKELVGFGNTLLSADTEHVVSQTTAGHGPAVELQVADAQGREFLIWYFYTIDSMQTGRDIAAQVGYGIRSLVGSPISSVIALRAPCAANCEQSRAQLRELLGSLQL
jgi:exosortase A